ncbi:TonB-dependent receptor (plasmid) [Sphingomonas paeninsulae]|uniref:TonB-dependent receptor n=1 Tax=Sphingomonas paeninsulae TaxID=2319844 RepID=A0A494TJP0_SPHPE|nr:TonB-dependent receptor [Sphingomonas paeninsulae]AYJ85345.1 TonB-dependent receptor [Sphingomonas paeninsulae]
MKIRKAFFHSALGVAALSGVVPAAAHDTAAQTAQDDGALQDIVVTAQKRRESLQAAPISISAFTAEDLERKNITGLADLRANVPNLQLTPHPNNAATTQIFLRGVGLSDDQITQDGSVAVYVDGVYVARSQGQALEVADLERIEVLRGPQGTLYGRNATGGAINFITRKPTLDEFRAKAQITVGNYSRRTFKGSVNVPIGNSLAATLSYATTKQDGFVRNLGTGVERFGDKDRQAMRGDVLWQPSSSFNLRYAYDRSQINDTPVYVAASPLFPLKLPRPTAGSPLVHDLLPNDITTQGHSLTAEWSPSRAVTVRSITAYRKLDNFQNQDYLTGVLGPFPLQKNSSRALQDQWSQELQLVGETSDRTLQYVGGLYYFSESGSNFSNSYSPPTLTRSFTTATINNSSYAIYGQVTLSPGFLDRRLHLTVGARQSWDKRAATLARQVQINNGPITDVPGLGNGRRNFDDFSPSIVVAFDATRDINLYAKAVKGYKAGGFNVRASSISRFNQGFDPEVLWSYEVGMKSEFLDRRLRFNVALFDSKYRDIQINVQSDPTNVRITDVLNAGRATVKGIEADLTLAPSRSLRFTANYGYLDARYNEILDARGVDIASSYRFSNAPKHSLALSANYELPRLPIGKLSADVNYTMQSKSYSSSTIASGSYIIGDYGLLNARLGLGEIPGLDGVRVGLWGRNLTDQSYYIYQFNIGRPGAIFGEPRTYGFDLIAEF